ncbi:MAG: hypothetical protein WC770_03910 [Phycisphaerae bacterium]|jgi:hypothetical protein
MNQINIKNIAIFAVVIFLMSRAKYIISWLHEMSRKNILTLEPIRDFPDGARAAITVTVYALIFVVIWKLILKK